MVRPLEENQVASRFHRFHERVTEKVFREQNRKAMERFEGAQVVFVPNFGVQ